VIRRSPASRSARAFLASVEPLVVMARSPSPGIRASSSTSRLQLAAYERLAAGQADLAHPVAGDEDPREPFDLLEPQKLGALEKHVFAPDTSLGMQ
jgi:hypothetical protein